VKQVGKIDFEFADKKGGMATSIKYATKMQLFETPDDVPNIIWHQYFPEEFDKDLTQ